MIDAGDLSMKPGWIRLSLHPTMKESELLYIIQSIKEVVENAGRWEKDYIYDRHTNEYNHKFFRDSNPERVKSWFNVD